MTEVWVSFFVTIRHRVLEEVGEKLHLHLHHGSIRTPAAGERFAAVDDGGLAVQFGRESVLKARADALGPWRPRDLEGGAIGVPVMETELEGGDVLRIVPGALPMASLDVVQDGHDGSVR